MSCSPEIRRIFLANTTDPAVTNAMWKAYEAQKRANKRLKKLNDKRKKVLCNV